MIIIWNIFKILMTFSEGVRTSWILGLGNYVYAMFFQLNPRPGSFGLNKYHTITFQTYFRMYNIWILLGLLQGVVAQSVELIL